MVTILIIGILSGVTLSVLNVRQLQARARDSQRIGDLKKIQTALELYFSENRRYPIHNTSYVEIASVNLTGFINRKPVDPKVGLTSVDKDGNQIRCATAITRHGYYYRSDLAGGSYVILSVMEVQSSTKDNLSSDLFNCTGSSPKISCGVIATDTYCYGVENPL